jgi:hypothetical protein
MATCKQCKTDFKCNRPHQVFCNRRCRKQFEKARYRAKFPEPVLSTGTTGAISELRVAVDLLLKGFEVFRAVSPACSCDLIAMREGKTPIRIEVRPANFQINGRLTFPRSRKDGGRQDHFAYVLPESIGYEPPL